MINVVCGIRSTGRICTDIAALLKLNGHDVRIAYGRESVPELYKEDALRIGSDFEVKIHGIKARIFDASGFGSKKTTERFIEWVKEYNPDVIHLHNIHGYYINVEILFDYLRTCGKKIFWTLHDCWPFTGHAAYCEAASCERWINGCYKCPKKDDYPSSFIDASNRNWLKKKKIFLGIPNMIIITPSIWLSELVNKSFLADYNVQVINNGIDTSIFKYTKSDIKKRLRIEKKKIILGVAALWSQRKGLDDFVKLSRRISPEYIIVLVGLSKKQIKSLPDGIIGIKQTNSLKELVELYSAADVYVNPTYEDNYPTTNLESIACGTPVISYDTGGSGESANMYGYTVSKGDIDGLLDCIYKTKKTKSIDLDSISKEHFVNQYMSIIES